MPASIEYQFSAEIWQHQGIGGWHFVSLPKSMARDIRQHLQWQEEGWGRMKATAEINGWDWTTAIWFDKKQATYLLPLKAEIRRKAQLHLGDTVEVRLWV